MLNESERRRRGREAVTGGGTEREMPKEERSRGRRKDREIDGESKEEKEEEEGRRGRRVLSPPVA